MAERPADSAVGDLLRRGIDRAVGSGPPIDTAAVAEAAAASPATPSQQTAAQRPSTRATDVRRIAAVLVLGIGIATATIMIGGESSGQRLVAETTDRFVESIFTASPLDDIELAVVDSTTDGELLPVFIDVADLF